MKKSKVKEILDRLKWHPECDFEKVRVRYINRPSGISELSGDEIVEIGHSFIYTHSTAIPHHRVVEIVYENKTIWKKLINSENP